MLITLLIMLGGPQVSAVLILYHWRNLWVSLLAQLLFAPAHPDVSQASPSPHGCPLQGCTDLTVPAHAQRTDCIKIRDNTACGTKFCLLISLNHFIKLFFLTLFHVQKWEMQNTLRLMRGKPCPGAGGRAGRGPFGGLDGEEVSEGEVFRLNGFIRWSNRYISLGGL